MIEVRDQMGNLVALNKPAQRIISLVPSQTEYLFDLDLEAEVIGITKFCIHPSSWFNSKERVGGTKSLHLDKIRNLNPDLIIGNKEENVKEQIEQLQADFPVYMSDIETFDQALDMMNSVSLLCGRSEQGDAICTQVRQQFEALASAKCRRVAYLIWKDPLMAVGSGNYIDDMLSKCGFENAFGDQQRYPETTVDQLQELDLDWILMSTEPFPFKEQDVAWMKEQVPQSDCMVVDGEMFSWYGSRMMKAVPYFESVIDQMEAANSKMS